MSTSKDSESETQSRAETQSSSNRDSKLYRGRAPIASMDAMEDMDMLTGSNPTIAPELHMLGKLPSSSALAPECHMLVKGTLPGLRYRRLGKSGLKISNIALGSLKVFTQEDPDASEELVTLAFENGINFFDISEPFTSKKAEMELGRIIKKKGWSRRQYVISTKVYWDKTEAKALSRKEIIESCNDSLRNLQLDYIDILIIHKHDPHCPIEEILRAMTFLIDSGKVMYWGTAKWSPVEIFETFSQARTTNCIPPVCEYAEYHPFHREKVELYMAELYNKIGMGLITWSPVSFGLCTGKAEDQLSLFTKLAIKSGRYNGMDMMCLNEGGEALNRIKLLEGVASRLGACLHQLLVAWCVRNNTSQAVVVSAATMEQLCQILNSLQILPKLTPAVLEEMDKILVNKPVRPPMVSTLQQRWAATGGMPPSS